MGRRRTVRLSFSRTLGKTLTVGGGAGFVYRFVATGTVEEKSASTPVHCLTKL